MKKEKNIHRKTHQDYTDGGGTSQHTKNKPKNRMHETDYYCILL